MSMRHEAAELYEAVRNAHSATVQLSVPLDGIVKSGKSTKEELANVAYALREAREFAEDIRKRCDALGKLAQRVACAQVVADGVADGSGEAKSIRTEHCVAVPMVRNIVSIPRKQKDPEAFGRLMDHLGVDRRLWDGLDHAIVEPHWPGLVDRIARDQAEGKPLPPGIDPSKTYPEYSLNIRGVKGVTDGAQATTPHHNF